MAGALGLLLAPALLESTGNRTGELIVLGLVALLNLLSLLPSRPRPPRPPSPPPTEPDQPDDSATFHWPRFPRLQV